MSLKSASPLWYRQCHECGSSATSSDPVWGQSLSSWVQGGEGHARGAGGSGAGVCPGRSVGNQNFFTRWWKESYSVILVYSLPPSPFNRHISEALRRALLKNLNRNRWGYAPEGSDTTIFSSTIMYFSWLFQLVSFVHDCIAPDLQRFKLLTTATPQENKNPRQGFS